MGIRTSGGGDAWLEGTAASPLPPLALRQVARGPAVAMARQRDTEVEDEQQEPKQKQGVF
jgi:hypothetical protein